MNQQPLFVDELLDTAFLSCGHSVAFDRTTHPQNKDGWPKAITCQTCRRPREISRIAFRRPRDP